MTPVDNLYETTEDTLAAAHQAGMAYWNRNRPYDATRDGLESLARSLDWHGEENQSFLAGFYGAKSRYRYEDEYNRELRLRLANVGPNGRLPPSSL